MSSIFEDLMRGYSNVLNESKTRKVPTSRSRMKTESKKISYKKIKLESTKIFEDADLDELDKKFDVDPDGPDEDEVVLVIDPEVSSSEEIPEDAAEEMIGDYVYKCPVCGGNYVCNCDAEKNESLEVNDEGVPVECPICGDDADQILVGEIAPADESAGEEKEMPDYDADDAEMEEESNRVHNESRRHLKRRRRIGEKKNCNKNLHEEDEYVYDDSYVLEPAIELVDEDKKEDQTPAVEINAQTVNLNLDDKKFESMINRVIRENYKNGNSFKITRASCRGSLMKIEYVVRSKGGKSRRGTFVGEGYNPKSRKSTIKFRDKGAFTESFSGSPSFIVEFVRVRNSMIPTGVKYDYKVKVNESVYRIYGNVGK